MMSYAIRVKNLTKTFQKNLLFKDISFRVKKGEILGIVGHSGAGKTTLLNIMTGLLKPDQGDVVYHLKRPVSIRLLRNEKSFNRLFGFSTQEGSFYEKLSIQENLSFYGQFYFHKINMVKLDRQLTEFDLATHRNTLAKNLSSGMQKKLDILCATIHKPRLLFLDEPSAHLDSSTRKQIWKLITSLQRKGTTVVVTSHFLEDLKKHSTRILRLHKHKLVTLK